MFSNKIKKNIKILLLSGFTLFISLAKAQDRVINTGVPFLSLSAESRAAGMADIGIASSADAFSQQLNPAKYAFAIDKQGFSLSYKPYLTIWPIIFHWGS